MIRTNVWPPTMGTCKAEGCLWMEEIDDLSGDRWASHLFHGERDLPSMEAKFYMPRKLFLVEGRRVLLNAFLFFEQHHKDPMAEDFDEERERARLVQV